MAINPDKNAVEQGLIARLIGKIKRIALDISDDVSAEETRAMAAEAAAKTVVTAGENCSVTKTTAADGHDVYTVNADGKPQVQTDWNQADSSKVDYIKNKPANLVQDANYVHTENNFTDAEKTKLGGIESGAQVNVIEKVKVNGTEQGVTEKAIDISVPTASTATPLNDGTSSAGSSTQWSRGDHVHPTDTSREAVSNKAQVVVDSSTTDYPSSKAVADFVNSSIATNTANFLGTYDVVEDLGLSTYATNSQIATALGNYTFATTPTNNDYVFAAIDLYLDTGADEYRRFKFNGTAWAYEYTLNNSSFTAAQWDAINSGLSSSDKATYDAAVSTLNAHVADSTIHVTSTDKTNWNAKQDAISTDTDSSTISDATTIATGYGSNKVHLNTASRIWAYIQDKISSVLGLTSSSYGGRAASLDASAGGPSQPVYFPSSGVNLGKPVAIPISTDSEIAAAGDFLTIQAQGAYYAHKAGNAATADAVAWANVSGKPSKYPADITVGDSMTLTGINLESGKRWTAVTHGQTWSRILQGLQANFACTAILSLSATRSDVVYNATFLICSTVSVFAEPFIAELGSGNYAKVRIRLVHTRASGSFYVEIYDTAHNIAVGTEQNWNCTLYPLLGTSFNAYTSFVDGSIIPSGYTAIQELITAGGHSSVAIRNITFSGTTLTATRQDGSTFTVSGLASDSSVVHLAGAETITGVKTFSGNLPIQQNDSTSLKLNKKILIGNAGTNYNSWDSSLKDGNHYRRWRVKLGIDSQEVYYFVVNVYGTYISRNSVGVVSVQYSVLPNYANNTFHANNRCYLPVESLQAAQEFRLSPVFYDDTDGYCIDVVSSTPTSNNPITVVIDVGSKVLKNITLSDVTIIDGWPAWAGDINVAPRLQSNERNVMLAGDAAASLNASAGGPSQPVYFPSSGADLGKPVAIPMSTDQEVAAVGDFLAMQVQGAYYAHKAGTAASAAAAEEANTANLANRARALNIGSMGSDTYYVVVFDADGHPFKESDVTLGRLLFDASQKLLNTNITGNATSANNATSADSATIAAKLNASAGSDSQPVYFPGTGNDAGKPVAIPLVQHSGNNYLQMQTEGAYYAQTAGTATSAVSATKDGLNREINTTYCTQQYADPLLRLVNARPISNQTYALQGTSTWTHAFAFNFANYGDMPRGRQSLILVCLQYECASGTALRIRMTYTGTDLLVEALPDGRHYVTLPVIWTMEHSSLTEPFDMYFSGNGNIRAMSGTLILM